MRNVIHIGLFARLIRHSVSYFFLLVGMLALNRLLFLLYYGNETIFAEKGALVKTFLVGFQFDASAVCYAFLPLALLWLISLGIPKRFGQEYARFFQRFTRWYLLLVTLIYASLCVIDFFYYQFFQSHLNILFFGIFYDDTQAVLRSVWTDYPIVKILIFYCGLLLAYLFISKRFRMVGEIQGKRAFYALLIIPLYIIGLRGTLGEFTLQREHTNICPNPFINTLCYNPVYALKFAHDEWELNVITADTSEALRAGNFPSEEVLLETFRAQSGDSLGADFYVKTPRNSFLKENPPNVVFILMESMSNHYFKIDNEGLNLLGDLRELLPELYYFKNGLSSFNGTIGSLESLLVGTTKGVVSQSPYFDIPYASSVAKPFREQGYSTSFLTGAYLSWRNIDGLLSRQCFDTLVGSATIEKAFLQAEKFAWGTHDGYLFDYMSDFLLHRSGKPAFVFALTISNHTPYEIPKHYTPYPIHTEALTTTFRVDKEMSEANFYSHQYACSQLAKFIKRVKASALGENTIIVATGDHNIRQVFDYDASQAFLRRSVPILFYIPKKYQPYFFNENAFVSHKDIFPTLYNLSLSEQKYIYTGDDMFQKGRKHRFAVNNYDFIADSIGVISEENQQKKYYRWKDAQKQSLQESDINDAHAAFLSQRLNTYKTLQTLRFYKDIQQNKP